MLEPIRVLPSISVTSGATYYTFAFPKTGEAVNAEAFPVALENLVREVGAGRQKVHPARRARQRRGGHG